MRANGRDRKGLVDSAPGVVVSILPDGLVKVVMVAERRKLYGVVVEGMLMGQRRARILRRKFARRSDAWAYRRRFLRRWLALKMGR